MPPKCNGQFLGIEKNGKQKLGKILGTTGAHLAFRKPATV